MKVLSLLDSSLVSSSWFTRRVESELNWLELVFCPFLFRMKIGLGLTCLGGVGDARAIIPGIRAWLGGLCAPVLSGGVTNGDHSHQARTNAALNRFSIAAMPAAAQRTMLFYEQLRANS